MNYNIKGGIWQEKSQTKVWLINLNGINKFRDEI